MGFYINPPAPLSKRDWLDAHSIAKVLPHTLWRDLRLDGHQLPVVYVDNGDFDAIGIAFDAREYERMTERSWSGDDPRLTLVHIVWCNDLVAFVPASFWELTDASSTIL